MWSILRTNENPKKVISHTASCIDTEIPTLHVIDAISFAGVEATQLVDNLATCALLAHRAPSMHCVCVVLSLATGPVSSQQALQNRRLLEDVCVKSGFEIGHLGSFRFKCSHDGDKRPLNQVGFLAMLDMCDNVFLSSDYALGKENANAESLLAVKDISLMRRPDHEQLPDGVKAKDTLDRGKPKISHTERIRQRGSKACASMVHALFTGVRLPHNVALLVEHFPTPAVEWLFACRDLNLGMLAGSGHEVSGAIYSMALPMVQMPRHISKRLYGRIHIVGGSTVPYLSRGLAKLVQRLYQRNSCRACLKAPS